MGQKWWWSKQTGGGTMDPHPSIPPQTNPYHSYSYINIYYIYIKKFKDQDGGDKAHINRQSRFEKRLGG